MPMQIPFRRVIARCASIGGAGRIGIRSVHLKFPKYRILAQMLSANVNRIRFLPTVSHFVKLTDDFCFGLSDRTPKGVCNDRRITVLCPGGNGPVAGWARQNCDPASRNGSVRGTLLTQSFDIKTALRFSVCNPLGLVLTRLPVCKLNPGPEEVHCPGSSGERVGPLRHGIRGSSAERGPAADRHSFGRWG